MDFDATISCMQMTLDIDEKLLQQAKEACGALTDTETVARGLKTLVEHAASQRLRALLGANQMRRTFRADERNRSGSARLPSGVGGYVGLDSWACEPRTVSSGLSYSPRPSPRRAELWTADERLAEMAGELGVVYQPVHNEH
jgi:Arc/MetJ family transcription regulator